jgi:hypothetical protein
MENLGHRCLASCWRFLLLVWPRFRSRGSASAGATAVWHRASRIEIQNISLSRAENFLHQEVTALSGDLINRGDRSLTGLQLTIEFFDELHQVVLRESRQVLSAPSPVFASGDRRSFEIFFEHIPSSWNMQQPSVGISGLQFAPAKE